MTRGTALLVQLMSIALASCSDRPLPTDTDGLSTSTTMSETDAPTSTSIGTSMPTGEPTTGSTPGTTSNHGSETLETSEPDATTGGPATACGACSVTWASEQNVDVFPGVDIGQFDCLSVVHGDLSVSGELSASELAALANITTVEGSLFITFDTVLTDLSPLACLREVHHDLMIQDAPALVDLAGLANLAQLNGTLHLSGTAVSALPALDPAFHGITALELVNNPALIDLGAASEWTPGPQPLRLRVTDNVSLASLDGLQPLVTAASNLEIERLPQLASLVGLETLSGTPRARLRELPALQSLTGLEGLVGGDLELRQLPLVKDLLPLTNLQSVDRLTLAGLPLVTSLEGLANLHTVTTKLDIGGCTDGMDGLSDLSGLTAVTSIDVLGLTANDALISLAGMDALTTLGSIRTFANPQLPHAEFDAFIAAFDPNTACFECLCSVLDDDCSN